MVAVHPADDVIAAWQPEPFGFGKKCGSHAAFMKP
jgi:hypothetical protein